MRKVLPAMTGGTHGLGGLMTLTTPTTLTTLTKAARASPESTEDECGGQQYEYLPAVLRVLGPATAAISRGNRQAIS